MSGYHQRTRTSTIHGNEERASSSLGKFVEFSSRGYRSSGASKSPDQLRKASTRSRPRLCNAPRVMVETVSIESVLKPTIS